MRNYDVLKRLQGIKGDLCFNGGGLPILILKKGLNLFSLQVSS